MGSLIAKRDPIHRVTLAVLLLSSVLNALAVNVIEPEAEAEPKNTIKRQKTFSVVRNDAIQLSK